MKLIKKTIIMLGVAAMLSGCSFEEIKSDKNIVISETKATTTTMQVLEVPELTTTTPAVTTPAEPVPGETTPVTEEESPFPVTMITTANVNARKGPSTADEIAQTVVASTEVTAIGYVDGWYQIDLNGETLYIIEDYLEFAPVEDESEESEQE
ncbi:MAG: SH3 domain-containing protein [Oscillospiraceae bacterium]|nr:SH3 domain-containing protein [Oscillospiraceae bacterium]MBQ8379010.1 SH3 domain-containing protein [Oscillospiraceae bacterium]